MAAGTAHIEKEYEPFKAVLSFLLCNTGFRAFFRIDNTITLRGRIVRFCCVVVLKIRPVFLRPAALQNRKIPFSLRSEIFA